MDFSGLIAFDVASRKLDQALGDAAGVSTGLIGVGVSAIEYILMIV